MNRLPSEDYERAHIATLEALRMMPAEFTLKQLTQDTNIQLEKDGIVATTTVVDSRLKEQVIVGAVSKRKSGKKGWGKGSMGKRYKVIGDILRIGAPYTPPAEKKAVKKQHKDLPEVNGLTPQDMSKFMLNYMTNSLGIAGSIEDLQTLKKDAETMHALQQDNRELVTRHNEDKEELEALKKEKREYTVLKARFDQVSEYNTALADKLAKIRQILKD